MRLTDSTYFRNNNELNIPLAEDIPSSYDCENNTSDAKYIDNLCERVESEILINSLGFENFEYIKQIEDLDAVEEHWRWLMNGHRYDNKYFRGLKNETSLLNYAVYSMYTLDMQHLSAIGTIENSPENAKMVTSSYKTVNSNNKFLALYQGECHEGTFHSVSTYRGVTYRNYYNMANGNEVSLKQFLQDFKDLFNVQNVPFINYNSRNSFGL